MDVRLWQVTSKHPPSRSNNGPQQQAGCVLPAPSVLSQHTLMVGRIWTYFSNTARARATSSYRSSNCRHPGSSGQVASTPITAALANTCKPDSHCSNSIEIVEHFNSLRYSTPPLALDDITTTTIRPALSSPSPLSLFLSFPLIRFWIIT